MLRWQIKRQLTEEKGGFNEKQHLLQGSSLIKFSAMILSGLWKSWMMFFWVGKF